MKGEDTMKHKSILAAVILCLACLVIFCLYLVFGLGYFLPVKEVKLDLCPMEDLFLSGEDMSGNAAVSSIRGPTDDDPKRTGYLDVYYNELFHGHQYVTEYSTIARTSERYKKAEGNLFDPDNLYLPTFDEVDHSVVWKVPDFEFTSHADEFYYACGKSDQGYVCRYIARYGRLLTRLNLDIKPVTGPTIANFQEAITAIDRKMAKCIADYPDER